MNNNSIANLGNLITANSMSNAYSNSYSPPPSNSIPRDDSSLMHAPSLNFKLHKAVGGFVIEISKMSKTDFTFTSKLYVADENGIGKQIEKIILLEMIKSDSETH